MNAFESLGRHLPLFAEARGDIQVSFEFFPPKTEKMEQTLWESIKTLEPLHPRFVSVTYGAGGSTRERTHATVERILKETPLTPAAHLTCVGASRDEIDAIARDYWQLGVRNIVALRGDPPEPGTPYAPHPQGYQNAADLVTGLKKVAAFDISVAAYPEIHPDSSDRKFDLENLKRKVDAGADRAITQFFFSPDCFFRRSGFVAEAEEAVGREEELGDRAVGPRVDLPLQVFEIELPIGRIRVDFGIGRDRNVERRDLLESGDEVGGILIALRVRCIRSAGLG